MFKRELLPAFLLVRRIHVLCFFKEVSVPSIVHLAYFQVNHQRISDLIPKIFSLGIQARNGTHTYTHMHTHIHSDPNLKK